MKTKKENKKTTSNDLGIPKEVLEKVTIRLKKINQYDEVWNSRGHTSRKKVSVWAPRNIATAKTLKVGKKHVQVVLGHFAIPGFVNPKTDKKERFSIEVTRQHGVVVDDFGERLGIADIVDKLFPKPLRFRQVWRQEGGDMPLYAWEGIPPNEMYTCLGTVATSSPDEPPIDTIRCIPLHWLVPTQCTPIKLWDDAGTGGKKGSFWEMSPLKTLTIVKGHEKPDGIFYQLWTDKPFKASQSMFG